MEQDARFPSGPWSGYFLQPPIVMKGWMELDLSFSSGKVTGTGRDQVGHFLMTGRYFLDDGRVHLTKQYLGLHEVLYDGYNEGKGIWGVWTITAGPRGGFHIWPKGSEHGPQDILTKAEPIPDQKVAVLNLA